MPTGDRQCWDSLFEEAVLDPTRWLHVLEELASATGSARAELVGVCAEAGSNFSWVTSVDQRTMQDFVASGGHSPHSNFRIASDDGKSVLTIVDERDYDRAKQRLSSGDFVDFCDQYEMVHGCQTVLLRERGTLIGLSLLRTRSEGRTGELEQRIFADGALAAARAVRLQRALEDQGHHLLAGTFEAMSTASLLIDGSGAVRSVTTAAERILENQQVITVNDNRLGSPDPVVDGEITRAIRGAIGPTPVRYARVSVDKASPNGLSIEVFGLAQKSWSMPFGIRALIIIRTPGNLPADAAQRLIRAFDLTPAEADVAMLLCQGVPRNQIAARRRVTSETLRSQLRALYSKMDCKREVDLVLLARTVLN
jgi:DNA-binding CsgD family transcriptional regulator